MPDGKRLLSFFETTDRHGGRCDEGNTFLLWRRRWDSNPRTLAGLRFSRPAQSTALPPLLI